MSSSFRKTIHFPSGENAYEGAPPSGPTSLRPEGRWRLWKQKTETVEWEGNRRVARMARIGVRSGSLKCSATARLRPTMRLERTRANCCERLHQLDKLGVTGSSPVPPITTRVAAPPSAWLRGSLRVRGGRGCSSRANPGADLEAGPENGGMVDPAHPRIYHITHVDNLSRIIEEEALWSDAVMVARGGPATAIGMKAAMSKPTPGITVRHARSCSGEPCRCKPTYQAHVWSAREGKRIRKTFPTLAAAKVWRQDALPALRKGTMHAPTQTTLRQAWEAWQAGALDGTIRTRSGDVYKPSALRGYEQAMRLRILDDLGAVKLSDVTRRDVQRLANGMLGDGCAASTIRNAILPLRSIYRRAIEDGDVAVNPCANLRLPAVRGRA